MLLWLESDPYLTGDSKDKFNNTWIYKKNALQHSVKSTIACEKNLFLHCSILGETCWWKNASSLASSPALLSTPFKSCFQVCFHFLFRYYSVICLFLFDHCLCNAIQHLLSGYTLIVCLWCLTFCRGYFKSVTLFLRVSKCNTSNTPVTPN